MNAATQLRAPAEADEIGRSRHHPAVGRDRLDVTVEREADGALRLAIAAGGLTAQFSTNGRTPTLAIDAGTPSHPNDVVPLAALVEAAFRQVPEANSLILTRMAGHPAAHPLATELSETGERDVRVLRAAFYQLPLLWRRADTHVTYPSLPTVFAPTDRPVPLRPPQPRDTMYARWLPQFGMTLSFRPIDRRRDLELFHGWMNQPRVAFFWELAQSAEALDRYLAEQEADPHIFGVIGSFDDEPVGYFEIYWAKEDRLGPHYEAQDYDRGWHGLIGNPRHLGRPKTLAWFRSLTHYLFLDDPRTMRIVGEPRASHHKMLSYCADVAYTKVKEFDFPHKRAALVCCERERFFREVPL